MLSLALMLIAQAAPTTPVVVAVALEGTAIASERTRVSALVAQVLRGIEGLDVLAIADIAGTVGEPSARAFAACADDPCKYAALGAMARGPLVLGALDALDGKRVRLDLRVVTATAGTTVRLSRDLALPLESGLIEAVGSLFPGRSVRPTGMLTVNVDVDNAAIEVDGTTVGVSPLGPFSASVGRRRVRALAPTGNSAETTVDVGLASASSVDLTLRDAHSAWPFLLTGVAGAMIGGGLTAGAIAAANASNWREACPEGKSCAAGFTAGRNAVDASTLSTEVAVANAFYIAAGAAVLGAVIVWFVEGAE